MNSSSSSSSSSSSRLQEYLSNIPFATLTLLIFNLFIHIFMFVTDYDIGPFTFFPYNVLYNGEWYRVFTSAFLHGGLMHIGMNMMSLVALGGSLEPNYGTTRFYYFTLLSIILEGIFYVTMTFLCAKISGDISYLYSNSIGYSGVLFSYAVIEAFHSPVQSRSVFGCFNVPTKAYPFVLLVILQIMLPNISFFGHLAGLLAGVVMMTGFGDKLLMPSLGCFDWIDSRLCLSRVRRLSSFKLMTTRDLVHPYFEARDCTRAMSHGLGIVWWVLSSIATLIWNIVMTIAGIIGIPTERVGSGMMRAWTSLKQCVLYPINAFNEFRRGTPSTSNDQGYESVALDSQHGDDVEAGSGVAMVDNPINIGSTTYQKTNTIGSKNETIARPSNTIGGGTMATNGNNRVYTRDLNAKFLERFDKQNAANNNGEKSGSGKLATNTNSKGTSASNKKASPNSPKTLNV